MNIFHTVQTYNGSAQGIKLLCLSCVAGMALMVSVTPVAAQSSDVMKRIDRLENEINTLNRAVYKGEMPPAGAYDASGAANLEVRLQQLETQLRDLTGQMEQQTYDIEQLKQRVEGMRGRARAPAPAGMQPQVQPAQPILDEPSAEQAQINGEPQLTNMPLNEDPSPPTGMHRAQPSQATDPAGQYEQAFAYLKSGDYGAAEQGFQNFLNKNPGHALSANAIYWLGETFYVRAQYEQAAKVFAEAYQKFPGGPKGADNLLKLGMSLGGSGKKKEACIALSQLSKEYPNGPGPILRRAEQEMARFDCR